MNYFKEATFNQKIAFLLVCFQWLLFSDSLPIENNWVRFYHTLFISITAYLLCGIKLKIKYLGNYRWAYASLLFSWFLLIISGNENIIVIVKTLVNIFTFFILIPVISLAFYKFK